MNSEQIKSFITAGNATFTLKSLASGGHYTYRLTTAGKASSPNGLISGKFFVSVLSGPDNTRDYTYAGMLVRKANGTLVAYQTKGSKVGSDAPSWRGFLWLVHMLDANRDISEQAEVHHMNRCGRCGRELTHPESIKSGLGPECIKKS